MSSHAPPRSGLSPAVGAAVVLLAALPFAGALRGGWLDWDDPLNFLENPGFRGFSGDHLRWMLTAFHVGHWMPLTWLSCAVDHALWGLDPRGWHATNVLLHGLAALGVAAVFERLVARAVPGASPSRRAAAAALGALAWAVHPLRVESVAWLTERRDVLSGALLFATVACYLRGAGDGGGGVRGRALAAALALYAASLASKSMGLTLPAVLLLLDAWPLGRFAPGPERAARARRALLEKLPFLVLAAAAALVALRTQAVTVERMSGLDEFGLGQRVALSARALAAYPLLTLLPRGLSPLYALDPDLDPASPASLGALAAVGAVTAVLVAQRRRAPALLAAWVAYAVLAAPLLGLVQVGHQRMADRYTYLAGVPLAALVAGLCAAAPRARAAFAGTGAAVLVLAVLASRQVEHWLSPVALWSRVVAIEPDNAIGRMGLGVALHRAGDFDGALEQYERGLAVARPDRRADLLHNRALARLGLERVAAARADLEEALDLRPGHLGALRTLRELERADGRLSAHAERVTAALRAAPRDLALRLELASLRAELGDRAAARGLLVEGLRIDPTAGPAHAALGALLLADGEAATAEEHLRRALAADAFDVPSRVRLGDALLAQGRAEEARAAWTRALELDPGSEAARRALAGV